MFTNLLMAVTLNTKSENLNGAINWSEIGWTEIIMIGVGLFSIGVMIGIVCGGKLTREYLPDAIDIYKKQITKYERMMKKDNNKIKKMYRNLSENAKYQDYKIYVNGLSVEQLPNEKYVKIFMIDDIKHNIYISSF